MAPKRYAAFEAESLQFLSELRDNNNREWFTANKARYEEHVLDVALRFIDSMQAPLAKIAPHFAAVPKRVGGSLMRIYRDTRFGRDKTPYKTNVGIQFRHEQAKDVHAPGYYVHIDPEQVFVGVGLWRPESATLAAIRKRIDDKPKEWLKALASPAFRRLLALSGDSLTRPPRGYPATHPLIDDIRRKDFIAVRNLDHADVLDSRFQRKVEATFTAATPFMQFLCKAAGVPF